MRSLDQTVWPSSFAKPSKTNSSAERKTRTLSSLRELISQAPPSSTIQPGRSRLWRISARAFRYGCFLPDRTSATNVSSASGGTLRSACMAILGRPRRSPICSSSPTTLRAPLASCQQASPRRPGVSPLRWRSITLSAPCRAIRSCIPVVPTASASSTTCVRAPDTVRTMFARRSTSFRAWPNGSHPSSGNGASIIRSSLSWSRYWLARRSRTSLRADCLSIKSRKTERQRPASSEMKLRSAL